MLRVKTFLDRSPHHGIGLFIDQDIDAGTLVWEFNQAVDLAYSPEQWNLLKKNISPQSFRNLRQLSYKEEGLIYFCLDNGQFMNHSETLCNVGHYGNTKEKMFALRDIARGEELLCNYHLFADPDDYHVRHKLKIAGSGSLTVSRGG